MQLEVGMLTGDIQLKGRSETITIASKKSPILRKIVYYYSLQVSFSHYRHEIKWDYMGKMNYKDESNIRNL